MIKAEVLKEGVKIEITTTGIRETVSNTYQIIAGIYRSIYEAYGKKEACEYLFDLLKQIEAHIYDIHEPGKDERIVINGKVKGEGA